MAPAGTVEYLAGYAWDVSDCAACGCRFTRHDQDVYKLLHESGGLWYYAAYRGLAGECRRLFEQRNRGGLRRVLSETPKYRFVIDRTSGDRSGHLLEVGCSRGYLTSYFILEGRRILGVDVASDAVAGAREAFGNHFALADSPAVDAGSPYDVVYHVGLIGCVCDPVGLTRRLLCLLKPGGRLLFNAPNRAALHLRDQLWLDSAPPPDVVTLFPEGFWTRLFSEQSEVVEEVETLPARSSVNLALGGLCGRRWRKPAPRALAAGGPHWTQPAGEGWRLFERVVSKTARLTGLARLARPRAADFGLFVQMTAR